MKIIFCIFFCVIVNWSWAQQSTVDSLQALLPTVSTPTEQANLYYNLAAAILTINPPEAIVYSNKAQALLGGEELALKGKIYQVRGKATQYLGQLKAAATQLDSAFTFLSAANHSLETINDNRCEIYYLLALDDLYKEPQQSIEHLNKVLTLIPTEKYAQWTITYNLQASAYGELGKHDSTLLYLDKSLQQLQNVEDSILRQRLLGDHYANRAGIYVNTRQYQKAAELFYQAIDVYDAIGATEVKSTILSNLSGVYNYLDDPQMAIQYVSKSIAILEETEDTLELCNAYYNLAVMFANSEALDTALVILDKIIPFYKANQYNDKLGHCYISKSVNYSKLGRLQEALVVSEKAAALKAFFNSENTRNALYQNQAAVYRKTGQLEKSKELYQFLIDSTEDAMIKRYALAGGIKTAVLLKDFELAYHYSQQQKVVEDSLASINEKNAIRDLEIKHETKELSQQNEALKQAQIFQEKEALQNRRLLYLTIGLSVLLVILLLLYVQYKTIKSNLQTRELKYQLLRNQMNPHFLFNVLGAIQSFIYTNNPIKAGDFLSSFATLVRAILDNSTQELISITKEIEWLENYVALQALRFGEQLDYSIEIDPALQGQDFLIPPMLMQPIIENALEHGFKDIPYKGLLSIKMTLEDEGIQILVKDNGVGFNVNEEKVNKQHVSHATRITKERIDLLNKKNAENITFKTRSIPKKGTTVIFHLPLET
ncbi:MAG: histidine kinase [Aureispira sp.]